jgi:phosphatidylserine/phosphatidylglycerophosphate/cardiolipin synthase-like enzyme
LSEGVTVDGPGAWFLPVSERPWSEGNVVTPLIHGAEYFPRVHEVVSAATSGDRVYFTDWRGDPDEILADSGTTVGQLMYAAARRGVEVRALLWRSHSDRLKFSAQQNQRLGAEINEAGGEALLDQRVRSGGCHHQKLLVVQHPGRPREDCAFVGGIDLCHARRDDAEHRGDPQGQPIDRRYGPRPPWHDAAVQIQGPAVGDVVDTFTQRWNDPTPLDHHNPYRMLLQRAARMPRRPQPLPAALAPPPAVGSHAVQLLRTYPMKSPAFPFAPQGERTVARGYTHAFDRAKKLIYIEDQYLWSDLVGQTLARALRREPQLQVIAVVPRFPDQDGRFSGPPNRLGQLAAIDLLRAAGGARFSVYDLVSDRDVPIYVHAKVCIVDDTWMTCGSDNFNRRSWTHDSEVTCAVVDRDCRLPREFRIRLWSEHLALPPDDQRLIALESATELWQDRARAGTCARIRPHTPDPVSSLARLWATPAYRLIFDPDGRPARLRGTNAF